MYMHCYILYASHNVARMGCRPPTLRVLLLSYRLLLVAEVESLVCARTLACWIICVFFSLSANSRQIRKEISETWIFDKNRDREIICR